MAGIKTVTEGRFGDIFRMDPRKVKVEDGYNVRRDLGDLSELKESIRANGYLAEFPIVVEVKGNAAFVRRGHRRLAAVMALIEEGEKIKAIPVVNKRKGVSDEQDLVEQIVGNTGVPLSPLDEAEAFNKLKGFGWQINKIAQSVGKSGQHVNNRLALMALPLRLQEKVRHGEVAVTAAQTVGQKIVNQEIDAKQAEEEIAAIASVTVASKSDGKPRQAHGHMTERALSYKQIVALRDKAKTEADREPLDAQERDQQRFWDGYLAACKEILRENKPPVVEQEIVNPILTVEVPTHIAVEMKSTVTPEDKLRIIRESYARILSRKLKGQKSATA